ncbi:Defect at low temperature protein 1 [Choanephora cucurbitarum]|uniref:Defect at low temperature protein 1 n=1 Tax=Choanephora cucurbitarum TaxID=101091 RepID=A0A1C7NN96_9FUNG|nr:Defect at low temperature protein 1 [Choanephora cucurbitarum]
MFSMRWPHYLYTASLFLLIFLTAVCIAISASDVIIQSLTNRAYSGSFDYRSVLVVGSSYVFLALASISFSCNRLLTVRASLQDIPKLYIPIQQQDLPKKVFERINHGLEQTKQIKKLSEPRPEDIQAIGWAKPGTHLFEGLDFKQAVARTPAIVEQVAKSVSSEYFRPLYVPVRQYIEFLMQQNLIDKQLGTVYLEGYELARFSQAPLSQEQYMDIMKHLAAILQNMGYNIKSSTTQPMHQETDNEEEEEDDHQSAITWRSRSTASKRPESEPYSIYDEDEVRNDIYELLMKDRASSHHRI